MNRTTRKIVLEIVMPLALLAAPFLLPIFHFAFDISTLLTVISLIFAILVGFFIATATTNYLRLQSLIADEDSALINIFNLSKIIQSSEVPRMKEAIDHYATAALDFELTEYVYKTQKEFYDLLSTLDSISPQDEKGLVLLENMHNGRDRLVRTRQEITLAARRIITWRHWIILILLAILLVVLLLSIRDGRWFFSLITGILSLATYFILTLLYEVDSNVFLEEQLAYENTQQIFQAIGTMKYIPHRAFQDKRVKEPKEDYRVGIFKDYPKSLEKEIKVIHKNS